MSSVTVGFTGVNNNRQLLQFAREGKCTDPNSVHSVFMKERRNRLRKLDTPTLSLRKLFLFGRKLFRLCWYRADKKSYLDPEDNGLQIISEDKCTYKPECHDCLSCKNKVTNLELILKMNTCPQTFLFTIIVILFVELNRLSKGAPYRFQAVIWEGVAQEFKTKEIHRSV